MCPLGSRPRHWRWLARPRPGGLLALAVKKRPREDRRDEYGSDKPALDKSHWRRAR
jgi:hypothetical protein